MLSYLAVLTTIFVIAAVSAMALNLAVGSAGQLTITQGALMGVGAYVTGLLAVRLSVDPAIGFMISAVVGTLVGVAFAAAAVRLHGYDFVLMSLVLQMMAVEIFRRLDVTGGSSGLHGIGRPSLFGVAFEQQAPFAALALAIGGAAALLLWRISTSSVATTLRGFRDSEASLAALGKDTTAIRLLVGAIAGFGGGVAGGIQASLVSFIAPDDFSVFLSVLIIIYLLVGGLGNPTGALVGVALLVALPEVIGQIRAISTSLQGPVQRIVYGLIVMGFIMFRPQGLVPERPLVRLGASAREGGDLPDAATTVAAADRGDQS